MIQKKRILAGLLGCLLACSQSAGITAQTTGDVSREAQQTYAQQGSAAEEDVSQLPQLPQELQPDYNDPDYVKHLMQEEQPAVESMPFSLRSAAGLKTVSPFTGLTYTHPDRLSGREIINGIDVSKWQAAINWDKVKKAGVEFVFIRCGYTSLSSKFAMYEDPYFKQNIEGAYKAGIKVGIYFFSNSMTVSEAKKEAEKTLELIGPYKSMITMPVVYDFEAFSNAYRAYGLSKNQITKNTLAYLERIQEEGYTPMYYSSPNFVNKQFDLTQLSDYDFWLANYATQTSYTGDFVYWQYSSTGHVDGISGNADCNFFYTNPSGPVAPSDPNEIAEGLDAVTGLMMTNNTTSSIEIEWDEVEDAQGYKVYRAPALGGTYKEIQVVSGSAITTHLDTKVADAEGRQYYYKVVPFIVENDEMKYGGESDVLTANTEVVFKHGLITKANINLREQAGTEYAAITVVPEGTVLTYKRFTFSTQGSRWYKVTYKKSGKSYTGYISGNYVKKYTYGTASKKANLRNGAGTAFKLKNVVRKGTDLTILKNAQSKAGVPWSRVLYKLNGRDYKGYMKTKFIRRY